MNKEQFLLDFESKNTPVEILDDVINWKVKVRCKCLLCSEEFYMTPLNLKRGSIHNKCSYKLRSKNKKYSTQMFKDKLQKVNNSIQVIGEYEKAIIPIRVKCSICGHRWESTPNNLLRGHGCPICYYKKVSNRMKKSKSNHNIPAIYKNLLARFSNLMFLNNVDNLTTIITCKCKNCNNIWNTNLRNLNNLKANECCPYCSDRLLSIDKLDDFLKNYNISRENQPLKWSDRIECICNVCGYKWNTKTNSLLQGKGCPKCLNKVKKTHEEFLQEINLINPNVELLSKYVNSKTKIKRRCKICNDISEMLPKAILKKTCKGCASINAHDALAKTPEEFLSDFLNKYNNYILMDTYVNSSTFLNVKHKKCGNVFLFNPSRIYNRAKHICSLCYPKNSNGEREIQNYLDFHKINYEQHKTFSNLRGINNGCLSYDFYLTEQNILIEFQGEQHYKPIDVFGGEEQFKIQQEHDKRKHEYAKQNNFKLIEIPYWNFDNIEEILSKELGLVI